MSVVAGHVCDIGEAAKAAIPFERVSITTYPNRCGCGGNRHRFGKPFCGGVAGS